ncbi:MAG TPA: L-threonylcarbamoyladenylate synthase, partial [Candidatus Sulfomarinibacteraceae bacterium]|nr:L-threonylcarbamoyladenylate synthase [Candidatus Sulfomarinibacteraceae bacterium]
YGIAVAPTTPGGIERLFRVKRRPPDRAIALLLADAAGAWTLGEPSPVALALAAELWPGPLTLVLRRHPDATLPEGIATDGTTVGVRLPDHPAPRALAAAVGPLPTTSANLSGRPDALDAAAVLAELADGVDLILDGGRTPGARPSTVVDVTTDPPTILRAGEIGEARVRQVCERVWDDTGRRSTRPREEGAPR